MLARPRALPIRPPDNGLNAGTLCDVPRVVRLTEALVDMNVSAPWSVRMSGEKITLPRAMPDAQHMISCAVSGMAHAGVEGVTAKAGCHPEAAFGHTFSRLGPE